jgi:hypothetical protein
MVDPINDGGTLIMESPAAAHEDAAYPPPSHAPKTAPKPFGTIPFGGQQKQQPQQPQQPQQQQQQQQQFHPSDPRGMSQADAGEMMYRGAPADRSQQVEVPRTNRVLVFVAVAVVTMVVVIVSGLVILAVSD